MYKNHKISVSIPAYNEEEFIGATIESVPDYVDYIIVVNDKSKDKTEEAAKKYQKKLKNKLFVITPEQNGGVGASIMIGHNKGIELGADIAVVMAGDNQMDPAYLPTLLDTLIDNNFDYTKGNRFFHLKELKTMPKVRLIGNIVVSFMTKFCTGYWSISDPLNGYTALRLETYKKLDQSSIAKRYDFEVSLLNELSLISAKVKDVFIPALYRNEVSDIKLVRDTLHTSSRLFKGFFKRLLVKYTLFNFSPIVLFYFFGTLMIVWSIVFGTYLILYSIGPRTTTTATDMLAVVPLILGFQLVLQAVVLDIYNEPK